MLIILDDSLINHEYKKTETVPSIDSFYFRLMGTTLTFTATDKDNNILGNINIKQIIDGEIIDEPECL